MNTKCPVIILGSINVGINLEGQVAIDVRGRNLSTIPGLQEAFDKAAAAFLLTFTGEHEPDEVIKEGNAAIVPELHAALDSLQWPTVLDDA